MGVLSDRAHHKLESNLDMLMQEYKFATSECEYYISLMYSCISFTFAFYGAILTLGQNIFGKSSDSITCGIFLLTPNFNVCLRAVLCL